MREGQLALRPGTAPSVLVPVADNRVTSVLNEIKVIGDDFLDRPAEAAKIALLPRAKLSGLDGGQVLHLVFSGIVNLMTQGFERRSDLRAPAFAEIRRVFDGACEIEKHERRLSAIQGCRST